MTNAISTGDRLALMTAGVAAAVPPRWRGGKGVLVSYGGTAAGTETFQFSPDEGTTWINIREIGGGGSPAIAAGGMMVNFELPPGAALRVSAVWTSGNAIAVGV
jgi:hypothetical protein